MKYLGVSPARVRTRWRSVEADGVRITSEAVAQMVGQRPRLRIDGQDDAVAEIVAAEIEDGWVVITFELPAAALQAVDYRPRR